MARTAKPKSTTEARFSVVQKFRDSDKYAVSEKPNYYNVGDDVSDFDEDRLKDLVKRGLVEEAEAEAEGESKTDEK